MASENLHYESEAMLLPEFVACGRKGKSWHSFLLHLKQKLKNVMFFQ